MKPSSFDRTAGLAAILAALVGLLYSVSFVVNPLWYLLLGLALRRSEAATQVGAPVAA
jgi:hypothetical protein